MSIRMMTKSVLLVTLGATILACGTTAPAEKSTPIETAPAETKEEDFETVRVIKAVKAPEYVSGIKHSAQDAFRRGVQLAHEVPPRYDEALDQFEEAISEESSFMEPYFNIAMIHERERRTEKALQTYQRSLEANPDSADARAFIGKIYLAKARTELDLGRTTEANVLMAKGKALFDNVLSNDYENVPANNALALYWLLKGKKDQAEEHVRQVLIMQPYNVTALNTRGLIYLNAGELDIAKWIFKQKVLGFDPNSVEALTNLGIVYVRMNDLPKAVQHFRRSVKLDKSNVAARLNLGAIQLNYLDYKGAKEQYDIVLSLQPKNVEAIIGLASSSYGLGDFQAAIDGYEKALSLDPRRAILLLKCGDLYEKKFANDIAGMKKAIAYYERYAVAANLPPTNKLVRKIPILKEMIEKGMIGPVKENIELKTPEGDSDTTSEGDAKPAEDASKKPEAAAPAAVPAEAPEATPKLPKSTEPAPEEAPSKESSDDGANKEEGK